MRPNVFSPLYAGLVKAGELSGALGETLAQLADFSEREEEIRRYVGEGRLVIGPWYILPDEFLVSPEATVRNLLIGGRVCHRFGAAMRIGYLPDCFGHIGQMPQILRGFNIDTACLWRGVGDHPTELRWRAPDGSKVLMLHLRGSYSNAAWLPSASW